jgi:multiple sugar transport system substrate-binding protein
MSDFAVRPSRRHVLGGAAAGLAAPFILRSEVLGQSTFDWKRFSGAKLDVMLVKNPRSDLLQAHEKEFTALTGIQVSSEQIPEQQQRQKAMIEFTSGRPTFDVCMLALHVQKRLAAKGRWLEDLRPFLNDASLTSPDFDYAD